MCTVCFMFMHSPARAAKEEAKLMCESWMAHPYTHAPITQTYGLYLFFVHIPIQMPGLNWDTRNHSGSQCKMLGKH